MGEDTLPTKLETFLHYDNIFFFAIERMNKIQHIGNNRRLEKVHNEELKGLYLWLGAIRVIREEGETRGTLSRETHAFFF
jgi:hypothetical protein